MKNKSKFKERFSAFRSSIKNTPGKVWIGRIILVVALILLCYVVYLALGGSRDNSFKQLVTLCENNPVRTICFFMVTALVGLWILHWYWINEKTWLGRKHSFIILAAIAYFLVFYTVPSNLSEVEKQQLRDEFEISYQRKLDSVIVANRKNVIPQEKVADKSSSSPVEVSNNNTDTEQSDPLIIIDEDQRNSIKVTINSN